MSDATKNKNKIKLPENDRGALMPIILGDEAIASTYDSSIDSDTEIALNSATGLIDIAVISDEVFVKFKTATGGTAVSSSNYDICLTQGRHTFGIESNITHISVISVNGGGAISVSEFSYSQ